MYGVPIKMSIEGINQHSTVVQAFSTRDPLAVTAKYVYIAMLHKVFTIFVSVAIHTCR